MHANDVAIIASVILNSTCVHVFCTQTKVGHVWLGERQSKVCSFECASPETVNCYILVMVQDI